MKRIAAAVAILGVVFGVSLMTTIEGTKMCSASVFADDGVKASILTKCADEANKDDGDGSEGIVCLLSLALTIMTYGVGVLGVLGIVISGIQYMTSQGDPAKMAKAKSRILQVVIGLIIYAVMWGALRFLVPGFGL